MPPESPPSPHPLDAPPRSPELLPVEKQAWSEYQELLALFAQLSDAMDQLASGVEDNTMQQAIDNYVDQLRAARADLTNNLTRLQATPDFKRLTHKILGCDLPATIDQQRALAAQLFQPFQQAFDGCKAKLAAPTDLAALDQTIRNQLRLPGVDTDTLDALLIAPSREEHDRIEVELEMNKTRPQWKLFTQQLAVLLGTTTPQIGQYLHKPTLASAQDIFTALRNITQKPGDKNDRFNLLEPRLSTAEAKEILARCPDMIMGIETVCATVNNRISQLPEPQPAAAAQPAAHNRPTDGALPPTDNKQVQAFNELASKNDHPAILARAARKYPTDYEMQLYEYNKQVQALRG